MRFAAAASLLALSTTVLAANPWKNLGGDLALIGPSYNSTFKAGDTIPIEYAFNTIKMANTTAPPTNSTGTPPTLSTGTTTLTSLTWVGLTGNQTVEVALDNGRNTGVAVACLASDVCTGNYYPKRIELTIPADSYAANYTLIIGYTLKLVGETKMSYKFPFNVVGSGANVTAPVALIPNAPVVKATLPVYTPPSSSGLVNTASKAVFGATMILASAMLLL
ncbi:hypothetical protein BGZ95_009780 [Linnemannia exigua]|uniref:Uncharacterized protein n=1 Tax=Linnemannia exigua TaxID=604196 RepID=A0AAD4H6U8_9FUNG|nr:hypothetical protein BGZ95_009780 [Linnemannia exigua]